MKKKHIWIIIGCIVIVMLGIAIDLYFRSASRTKLELEKLNYCVEDKDCINIGSYCRLGCNILVNSNEELKAKKTILNYYLIRDKANLFFVTVFFSEKNVAKRLENYYNFNYNNSNGIFVCIQQQECNFVTDISCVNNRCV